MIRMVLVVFCFVGFAAMPFNAFAHGTDYRLIAKDMVVAVEFFYSDKTPIQYAEILIFSPENATVEYQNGRTDQNGRFAFLPETPGQWKLEVSDGMGHAVHAAITVNVHGPEVKENGESSGKQFDVQTSTKTSVFDRSSMVVKVVLGLSLLLNLFLAISKTK